MDYCKFAIFTAIILATGFALTTLFVGPRKMHAGTAIGLSWTFGIGAVSTVLMVISLLGRPPKYSVLAATALISVAVIIARRRALPTLPRLIIRAKPPDGLPGVILSATSIALIAVAISSVYCESRLPGLADIDSYAIWVLKAKVVAAVPLRPMPVYFVDPALSFSHQDYPLAVPLTTAAVHVATGWEMDTCAKSLLVPNFVAMVLVTYGGVRSIVSRSMALALTAVFVSGSTLISLAGTAEAELPLLLQHTASLCLLMMWMHRGGRGWLLAAGAAAAFAAMTKNEGLALMPILGAAALGFAAIAAKMFLGHRSSVSVPPQSGGVMEPSAIFANSDVLLTQRRFRDCVWAFALSLSIALPWLIYRTHLPHTHEDYGGKLSHAAAAATHVDQLALICQTLLGELLRMKSIGGFWLLLPVAAILGWRAWRQPAVWAILFILLAHVGLYVLVFLVTPWDLATLLPMVSAKLMMHASPAALLLIAMFAEPAVSCFPSVKPTAKTPAMVDLQRE